MLTIIKARGWLDKAAREKLSGKYGTAVSGIDADMIALRDAGCVEMSGQVASGRGQHYLYRYLKDYDPLGDKKRARSAKAVADAAKFTSRNCLCCGDKFASQGFHNRLCDPCRSAPVFLNSHRVVG